MNVDVPEWGLSNVWRPSGIPEWLKSFGRPQENRRQRTFTKVPVREGLTRSVWFRGQPSPIRIGAVQVYLSATIIREGREAKLDGRPRVQLAILCSHVGKRVSANAVRLVEESARMAKAQAVDSLAD